MSSEFEVKAHDRVDDSEEQIEKVSTTNTGKSTKSRLSPSEKFPEIDEKKLMKKIDWHLLPLVSGLYLLAYLDRGNVGNAKIEGLAEDLKLTGNQYNVCLTIFFITYSVFEVPSNVVLKMTKPSVWLPIIMVAWGIVMTLMGVVHNYMGLFFARFFLGVAEAGLFPGIAYLLTNWYCRHEYQFRLSLFYAAASIAGAFSGILAFGIGKMDGVGGYAGWRWIFILEGLLTVVVAVISFFFISDYPQDAKFLTQTEKEFILYKMEHDNNVDTLDNLEDHNSSFFEPETKEKGFKYFKQAMLDWQIYCHVLIYYAVVSPTYGVALFLPTIIRALGYTAAHAQLLSIPIYVCASIVSVVIAYCSDKAGKRSPFLILCFLAMITGFSVCIGYNPLTSPGSVYAGIMVAVSGMYSGFPAVVSWASNNLSGDYKRAIGLGLLIGLGNFGGAFGSNIFRTQDAPHFTLGHAVCLGFVGMGLIMTIFMAVMYFIINRKREREVLEGKYKLVSGKKLAEMGDRNPYFRYRL